MNPEEAPAAARHAVKQGLDPTGVIGALLVSFDSRGVAIERVRTLAEDSLAVDGTTVDTVWPAEILAALDDQPVAWCDDCGRPSYERGAPDHALDCAAKAA